MRQALSEKSIKGTSTVITPDGLLAIVDLVYLQTSSDVF
jgi:hypothetical protein